MAAVLGLRRPSGTPPWRERLSRTPFKGAYVQDLEIMALHGCIQARGRGTLANAIANANAGTVSMLCNLWIERLDVDCQPCIANWPIGHMATWSIRLLTWIIPKQLQSQHFLVLWKPGTFRGHLFSNRMGARVDFGPILIAASIADVPPSGSSLVFFEECPLSWNFWGQ